MSLTLAQAVGIQISKYFNVAGMAILIYDYAITIEDEISMMWGRSYDAVHVIFMVSRYIPFVGMGLTAYAALQTNSVQCHRYSYEENAFHVIGIISSEMLLIVRTYAFWKGDKRVLYGLIAYGTLIVAGALTIGFIPDYNLLPNREVLGGCYLVSTRNSALVYAFILAFEIVILFLTTYKEYHDYRHVRVRKSLIHTLFFDGVFYITCIGLVTVANVIIDAAFPVQYSDMLDIPQITLHSVLASRIMFRLRKSTRQVQVSGKSTELSTMTVSEFQYRVPTELDPV